MDPRIRTKMSWIRTKMSWIRNTAENTTHLNTYGTLGCTIRPTQGEVSGGGAPAQAVHPIHVESAGEVGEHRHRGKVNQLHGAVLKKGE